MLTLQWILAGAALVCAFGAFMRARRVAKRLEKLTESYWELRYEHGQLRARVARLEPLPDDVAAAEKPRQSGAPVFIPLSSLTTKR